MVDSYENTLLLYETEEGMKGGGFRSIKCDRSILKSWTHDPKAFFFTIKHKRIGTFKFEQTADYPVNF